MATKELTIKVNIQGQEVVLAGKQIETLKKNLQSLKDEFQKLGERTEQNAEIFDKLKGDIEALDAAFGNVKDEATSAGEEMEDFGKKSEESGKKTQSLRAQLTQARNDLIALGDRTAENAVEYDKLASRIQTLSDQYEDVQFGTKKLDDALGSLPGPIGKAAQGFKSFDDGLKNAKSSLGTLGREFPKLSKAIGASGIGALVIIFGLLVAAVMKAFNSFKPLQDAMDKLSIATDLLGKLIQPIIDLIGKGLTIALEALAYAIAFVTGNMDEYNKALADKKATEDLEKNVKRQEELLDSQGYKYDEFTKRKIQANIDYNKKKLELDADETRSEQEKLALLKQYREKANYEIEQADKDRAKKSADAAKSAADKAADIEKDFQKRLKSLKDDNRLLEIKDEEEKGRAKLKLDYDSQIAEINQLKVSEKKKQELRAETLKNYEIQLKLFNENIAAQEKKANEDLAKQVRDIQTSMIEDDKKRMEKEAENRRDDAIKAIDETKASGKAKAAAKLAIEAKYNDDVSKIDEQIAQKNKDNVYKQIEFERQSRLLALDNKLKEIDLSTMSEVAKIEARRKVFEEQSQIDNTAEIDNLKKLLETKEITQQEFDTREAQVNEATRLANLENAIMSEQAIRDARYSIRQQALDDLISIAGAETNVGKALLVAKQILAARELALEVSKTIAFSSKALARSTVAVAEGTAQTAKIGFPQNIPMLIGYAAQAAGIIMAIRSAVKSSKEASADVGSAPATPNMGRNYATGGMIGGRRHAQGGTLIEAEAGEAIMTRGAVTMFQPMLSMMNQMGGGTAFNRSAIMTSFDAPQVEKPSQEPTIIKTYVVSNELTNEAEKQARLKDLSTL